MEEEGDSLKVFLKEQIINAFNVAFSNMNQKSAILITDDHTTQILDTCFKVHQLNDKGIGAILNVKYQRERVPVPPIYFLSSNMASIEKVVKDYENSKQPQYTRYAHLFICSSISEDCFKLIKTSNLRRHLKTFQEVYCDFHALESRVFHFNRPGAFQNIYLTSNSEMEIQDSAKKLFSVCVALKEHPYIRYTQNSRHAHVLAQKFDEYFRQQKTDMSQFNHSDKRGVLLIVDRTQDPVAPVLHEITYQAMIKDLLPGENKYISLGEPAGGTEKKEADSQRFVYEEDPMWNDFKHLNLATLLKKIETKFKSFKATNKIAKVMLDQKEKDLLKNIRDFPKYKKMTDSFNSHFAIKDKLVRLYRALDLRKIGELEQTLVTGLDKTGRSCKLKDLQTQLSDVLRDTNVGTDIKLRLLLIYIISQGGVKQEKLKGLLKIANLSERDSAAIYNMESLGVRIKSGKKTTPKSPFYSDMLARAKILSSSTIVQSRYDPLVATLLRKFDKLDLSLAHFPFWREQEDRRQIASTFGGRSSKKKDRARRVTRNKKSKIIVFVIGGVCYSEIRECYLLSEELKRDIFIGSSHVMSPKEYINLLKGPDKQVDKVIEVKADYEVKQR